MERDREQGHADFLHVMEDILSVKQISTLVEAGRNFVASFSNKPAYAFA
jgi:hypothetical protein